MEKVESKKVNRRKTAVVAVIVAVIWVCPKFCVNTEMRCK